MEDIGRHIKSIRGSKCLTQKELATMAGVGGAHLSRIEAGKKPGVSFETIRKIADALGCTLDELAGRNGGTV